MISQDRLEHLSKGSQYITPIDLRASEVLEMAQELIQRRKFYCFMRDHDANLGYHKLLSEALFESINKHE